MVAHAFALSTLEAEVGSGCEFKASLIYLSHKNQTKYVDYLSNSAKQSSRGKLGLLAV